MKDCFDVVIVGGGLAGMSCARVLAQAGVDYVLIEGTERLGGRVKTDYHEGFHLDHGFQVLLDAYPECAAVLDYKALALRPFISGARIRREGGWQTMVDPWRNPSKLLSSALGGVGTPFDKWRIARLRSRLLAKDLDAIWSTEALTTLEYLRGRHFSSRMIDGFFRPFIGGIFLDSELETSSRMFEFVFKMFSSGRACLPSSGMQSISGQLADSLDANRILLGRRVQSHDGEKVTLAPEGKQIQARKALVFATESGSVEPDKTKGRPVTCLYFSAEQSPLEEAILVLNGEGLKDGPVNNFCVPSDVAPDYAPPGKVLISVTVLGQSDDPESFIPAVKKQLRRWFGEEVEDWGFLRAYGIRHALPRQLPDSFHPCEYRPRKAEGLYTCGDHEAGASLHGAMLSGRLTAEAIIEDLRGQPRAHLIK